MAFFWGLLACIVVGIIAEFHGIRRGKNDLENKSLSLLFKLSELINDGDNERAQKIINRFTSGEMKIQNISLLSELE